MQASDIPCNPPSYPIVLMVQSASRSYIKIISQPVAHRKSPDRQHKDKTKRQRSDAIVY